jgi:hypothetical protein
MFLLGNPSTGWLPNACFHSAPAVSAVQIVNVLLHMHFCEMKRVVKMDYVVKVKVKVKFTL